MAFDDALFQLGMDLTRSSTAQKEDHDETARLARHEHTRDGREWPSRERDSSRFAGTHVSIDLNGGRGLDDLRLVGKTLESCAESTGAPQIDLHLDRLPGDGGIHGLVVLRGGHISLNAWPRAGYATVDVFLRGSGQPYEAIRILRDAFEARSVTVRETRRGELGDGLDETAEAMVRVVSENPTQQGRLGKVRASRAA